MPRGGGEDDDRDVSRPLVGAKLRHELETGHLAVEVNAGDHHVRVRRRDERIDGRRYDDGRDAFVREELDIHLHVVRALDEEHDGTGRRARHVDLPAVSDLCRD